MPQLSGKAHNAPARRPVGISFSILQMSHTSYLPFHLVSTNIPFSPLCCISKDLQSACMMDVNVRTNLQCDHGSEYTEKMSEYNCRGVQDWIISLICAFMNNSNNANTDIFKLQPLFYD